MLYELYALDVEVLSIIIVLVVSIIMVLVESIIIVLEESIIIELESSIIIELELSSIIMLLVDIDMSAIAVDVVYDPPYAALEERREKKRGEVKNRTQHEPKDRTLTTTRSLSQRTRTEGPR